MRDTVIDIAKGICIILMVIGHCSGMPKIVYGGIESFHMPFFFIAGGLFYRLKPLSKVVGTGLKRLIVPLLIGVAICVAICLCCGNEQGALNYIKALLFPGGTRGKDILAPNWPNTGALWFLAALFWTRLIYTTLDIYFKKHVLIICALLSWTFIILAKRIMLPLCICEGFSGLIFYAIGRYTHDNDYLNYRIPQYAYVLFILIWIVDIHFVYFGMYQCRYTWYLWPMGVCFAIGMSKVIYDLSKVLNRSTKFRWLAKVGVYSLEILCCHQIIRAMGSNVFPDTTSYVIGNSFIIIGTFTLSAIYISAKAITKKIYNHE